MTRSILMRIWQILPFLLLWQNVLLSQPDTTGYAPTDTLFEKPEHAYKNKSTFESIVSLPGQIVYLPFWAVFTGTSNLVGYVYENKLIDRGMDLLTSDDGRQGVRPIYNSRTGLGAKYFHRDFLNAGSKLEIGASLWSGRRQSYFLHVKRMKAGFLNIYPLAQYRLLPDERFFGIGPQTVKTDETTFNYSQEQIQFQLGLGPRISNGLDVSVTLGYDINNILRGKSHEHLSITDPAARQQLIDLYGPDQVLFGVETGLKFLYTGISLQYTHLNNEGNPTSGTILGLEAGSYRQNADASRFDFNRLQADAAQHIHLFHDRYLVVRLAGEFVQPLDGKEVPFFYLSEIGRHETVRGFTRGRFRDEQMVMGSLEYRFPIRRRVHNGSMNMLLFVDTGKVDREGIFSSLRDDLLVTYGFGLHVLGQSSTFLKLEAGFSEDGFRFNLKLN